MFKQMRTKVALLAIAALAVGLFVAATILRNHADEPVAGRESGIRVLTDPMTEGIGTRHGSATFTIGEICSDIPDEVRISDVRLSGGNSGLGVVGYSVFPTENIQMNTASDTAPLSEMPWLVGSHIVSNECQTDRVQSHSLAVEVERRSTVDAESRSVVVEYLLDGRRRTTIVPYGFMLCVREDRSCM